MEIKKILRRLVVYGILGAALLAAQGQTNREDKAKDGVESKKEEPKEFIAPNTADVRGTWSEQGFVRGWYGFNKKTDFNYFSLKQYGTNVTGVFQEELSSDCPSELVGRISSNRLELIVPTFIVGISTNTEYLNIKIEGDKGKGTHYTERLLPAIPLIKRTSQVEVERISGFYLEKLQRIVEKPEPEKK